MAVNKVILVGNLGRDPELRQTASQTQVCTFSLATSERRKDQTGNWNDHTEWHNVVAFGRTAENCAKFLKKGSQVFIEGKLSTSKWQDKEGNDRYKTEVIANNVQFLSRAQGARSDSSGFSNQSDASKNTSDAADELLSSLPSAEALDAKVEVTFNDDDIPF